MKLRTVALSLSLFAGNTYADTIIDACFNCPPLDQIADADTFNDAQYYADAIAAISSNSSAVTIKENITTAITANHKNLTYSEVWTALTLSLIHI